LHFKLVLLEGNDESALSKNKGNFIEIVDLLAEFNPEIAKVVGVGVGGGGMLHVIRNIHLQIFIFRRRS
jgi:hypothetical protein